MTEYLRVTQVLKSAGLLPPMDFIEPVYLEWGQAIHEVVEAYDLGTLKSCANVIHPTTGEKAEGSLEAWIKFRKDTGFVPSLIEHQLENVAYKVRGRVDRTGLFPDGKMTLGDIKSGPVAPWTAIQTAAYAWFFGPVKFRRWGLELKTNGTYKLTWFDNFRDRDIWLAALTCACWARDHK